MCVIANGELLLVAAPGFIFHSDPAHKCKLKPMRCERPYDGAVTSDKYVVYLLPVDASSSVKARI